MIYTSLFLFRRTYTDIGPGELFYLLLIVGGLFALGLIWSLWGALFNSTKEKRKESLESAGGMTGCLLVVGIIFVILFMVMPLLMEGCI